MSNKFSILVGLQFLNSEEISKERGDCDIVVTGFITCCTPMIQHITEVEDIYIKRIGPAKSFMPRLQMKKVGATPHGNDRPLPLNYCPFCGAEVISVDYMSMNRITSTTVVNISGFGHFRSRTAWHITPEDVMKARHQQGD